MEETRGNEEMTSTDPHSTTGGGARRAPCHACLYGYVQ